MNLNKLIFAITFLFFISCKKDYTCECSNLSGITVYHIHNTKKKAEKECAEKPTYNNSQESNCKIK